MDVCERTDLCAYRLMNELKVRITELIATIDNAMLERIWYELDYWFDVCRLISNVHVEYL